MHRAAWRHWVKFGQKCVRSSTAVGGLGGRGQRNGKIGGSGVARHKRVAGGVNRYAKAKVILRTPDQSGVDDRARAIGLQLGHKGVKATGRDCAGMRGKVRGISVPRYVAITTAINGDAQSLIRTASTEIASVTQGDCRVDDQFAAAVIVSQRRVSTWP